MDSYKVTFETWDKVAKLYQDKFMDLNLYDDTYDAFCNQIIKVNPVILEIGCGPGNITKYLLTKRSDFNIQAIDISPKMIELAKINNPAATFKVMDSRAIEKIETKFDGIICGFCIPYLSKSDCSKLIMDCKKLLVDNGSLYMSFVEGDYNRSGYLTGSSGDSTYFYYHTLEILTKELKDNNFEDIKLLHKNYPKNDGSEEIHTIIIAKK
jgi:2-polyprenyl-3-methyl-5-hydroxy-6-metoxy-1,4-benzoquinol methylase